MKKFSIIILVSVIISIFYITSKPDESFDQYSNLDGSNNIISKEVLLSRIDDGRSIYKEKCSSCHGNELAGNKFWRIKKDVDELSKTLDSLQENSSDDIDYSEELEGFYFGPVGEA